MSGPSDEQPPDNVRRLRTAGRSRTFPGAPQPGDEQMTERVKQAEQNGRGRSGGTAGEITRAQRRARVIAALASGLTEEQVAQQFGMTQQGVSHIKRSELAKLAAVIEEQAQELRSLDLVRLEAAIRAIYPGVLKGNLPSIDRLVKLIQQRQKLLGAAGNDDSGETNNFFIFDPERVKDLEKLTFDVEGTAVPWKDREPEQHVLGPGDVP